MKLIILLFIIGILFFGTGTAFAQSSTINETGEITISKTASSNTIISNGSSFVGPFSTTYMITGNAADIKNSKDLILETVTNDFNNSSTVGYVSLSNKSSETANAQQIANPFASNEQISQKIQQELDKSISNANIQESNLVSITCQFGNFLDLFSCSNHLLSK